MVPPDPTLRARRRDRHDRADRPIRTVTAITLTGPGGVGKTRLAVAVGQELAADHPDGVVRVSLAALADADDVVGTDRPGARRPRRRAETRLVLAEQLGQRRLLLVLDNFEHLLSAAA